MNDYLKKKSGEVNVPVIGILVSVIGTQIILHFNGISLILTIFYNPCY